MSSQQPLTYDAKNGIMQPEEQKKRVLLLSVRQALIMILGALEDYLEMERSIVPNHIRKRNAQDQEKMRT